MIKNPLIQKNKYTELCDSGVKNTLYSILIDILMAYFLFVCFLGKAANTPEASDSQEMHCPFHLFMSELRGGSGG